MYLITLTTGLLDGDGHRFDRIVQDFEARRAGHLVYRDRFRWDGPWDAATATWYFGGELAAASLFVAGQLPAALAAAEPGTRRAVFPLGPDACCVRWVGHPGAVTTDLVRTAMRVAGDWTGGPAARPWLLDSSELSPNHWFSKPVGGLG